MGKSFGLAARIAAVAVVLTPISVSAQADHAATVGSARIGAFAGTRIKLAFGPDRPIHARASLALAPTFARSQASLRIAGGAEWAAFDTHPRAAMQGDSALTTVLARHNVIGQQRNLSTAAWVGVGVGVLAATLALVYFSQDCQRLFNGPQDCEE